LELLEDFLKLVMGSSDLFLDESCTLLQITPNVAHKPFPILAYFKEAAPVMEATPGTPEPPGGRGLTLVLILFPLCLEY
jgi:hypothetical protein